MYVLKIKIKIKTVKNKNKNKKCDYQLRFDKYPLFPCFRTCRVLSLGSSVGSNNMDLTILSRVIIVFM